MKRIFIYFSLFLILFSNIYSITLDETSRLNINLESSLFHNNVSGNKENSILTPGFFVSYLLSGNYYKKFNNFYVHSNVSMLYTDDKTINTDYFEFKQFFFELSSGYNKINIGDFYTDFSRYTIGTAGKGIKLLLQGFDYFFTPFLIQVNPARENSSFARYAGGVKFNKEFGKNLNIGINFVHTFDDSKSLNNINSLITANHNSVFGINFDLYLNRNLKFDGEISTSYFYDNNLKESKDIAFYLKNDFSIFNIKGYLEYERIGSNFYSLVGYANTDRQTIKTNLYKYFLNDILKVFLYFERYNDNVNNYKDSTTITLIPKTGISLYMNNTNIDYAFQTISRNDNNAIDNINFTNSIDVWSKILNFKLLASFENSIYNDKKDSLNDYTTNFLSLNLKLPLNLALFIINYIEPGIGYSLNIENIKYLDSSNTEKSGNNIQNSIKFSLNSKVLKNIELGALIDFRNAIRANANDTKTENYNYTLTYNFTDDETSKLNFEYDISKFLDENNVNSYREEVWKITFNLQI